MTEEDLKYFSGFLSEFQKETDRGAALVGAALIDTRIDRILRGHFVSKRIADELLSGGNAPIGTFSARMKLAYSLGLITRLEFHECDLIRKIRNEFAHEVHGLSFQTQKISDLAARLQANTPDRKRFDGNSRQLFINSVILLSMSLWYRPEYAIKFRATERSWSYQLAPDSPPKEEAEQGGTGQPATRPESKSEGSDKPQPEAEGRSR